MAMITDDRKFISELGLCQIMPAKARKSMENNAISFFNFEAENYIMNSYIS